MDYCLSSVTYLDIHNIFRLKKKEKTPDKSVFEMKKKCVCNNSQFCHNLKVVCLVKLLSC